MMKKILLYAVLQLVSLAKTRGQDLIFWTSRKAVNDSFAYYGWKIFEVNTVNGRLYELYKKSDNQVRGILYNNNELVFKYIYFYDSNSYDSTRRTLDVQKNKLDDLNWQEPGTPVFIKMDTSKISEGIFTLTYYVDAKDN